MKTNKKMVEALELYSDNYISFSDQHLTNIVRDILEEEYWEYWVEMIFYYLSDWLYYVIDRDKVDEDSEWKQFLMWWGKNNPDKVKEVINRWRKIYFLFFRKLWVAKKTSLTISNGISSIKKWKSITVLCMKLQEK